MLRALGDTKGLEGTAPAPLGLAGDTDHVCVAAVSEKDSHSVMCPPGR